jgi:hypothetical protein
MQCATLNPSTPGDNRVARSSTKPARSFGLTSGGLRHGERPGPVIAVPRPTRADANVHDVVSAGRSHAVRVLGKVSLQTAIAIDARRRSLALHGQLVVPANDQRYMSQGGQVAYFREPRLVSKTTHLAPWRQCQPTPLAVRRQPRG